MPCGHPKAFPQMAVNYYGDGTLFLGPPLVSALDPRSLAGFTAHWPRNGTQPFAEVPSFQPALTLRKNSWPHSWWGRGDRRNDIKEGQGAFKAKSRSWFLGCSSPVYFNRKGFLLTISHHFHVPQSPRLSPRQLSSLVSGAGQSQTHLLSWRLSFPWSLSTCST